MTTTMSEATEAQLKHHRTGLRMANPPVAGRPMVLVEPSALADLMARASRGRSLPSAEARLEKLDSEMTQALFQPAAAAATARKKTAKTEGVQRPRWTGVQKPRQTASSKKKGKQQKQQQLLGRPSHGTVAAAAAATAAGGKKGTATTTTRGKKGRVKKAKGPAPPSRKKTEKGPEATGGKGPVSKTGAGGTRALLADYNKRLMEYALVRQGGGGTQGGARRAGRRSSSALGSSPGLGPGEGRDVLEDLTEAVPPSVLTRARSLLKMLRKSTGVDWTESGELVIDGEVVPGTNLADLLVHAASKRQARTKTSHLSPGPPPGFRELAPHLERAPRALVQNRRRWKSIYKGTRPTTPIGRRARPWRRAAAAAEGTETPRSSKRTPVSARWTSL